MTVSEAFPQCSVIKELGLYMWQPGLDAESQLKAHCEVSVSDILTRLDSEESKKTMLTGWSRDRLPLINLSGIRYPLTFHDNLPPQRYVNRFPNDQGYIVPLYIAIKRGLSLSDIDFVLGGSSLDFLVNQGAGLDTRGDAVVFLTQRAQNVIFFVKSSEYVQDHACHGFQFERLVTGERMSGKHDSTKHENLQVLKIGDFTVLFSADVDAVDSRGELVEIKSGNPRYFGSKVMLQMISSGSTSLVQADKRGPVLLGVRKRGISDLFREHSPESLLRYQARIIRGLAFLKSQKEAIKENIPSEVSYVNGELSLTPQPYRSVLPSMSVVQQLLQTAAA